MSRLFRLDFGVPESKIAEYDDSIPAATWVESLIRAETTVHVHLDLNYESRDRSASNIAFAPVYESHTSDSSYKPRTALEKGSRAFGIARQGRSQGWRLAVQSTLSSGLSRSAVHKRPHFGASRAPRKCADHALYFEPNVLVQYDRILMVPSFDHVCKFSYRQSQDSFTSRNAVIGLTRQRNMKFGIRMSQA